MALLTVNYYTNQVKDFIADVANTSQTFYVFAGKPTPWPDDSAPPAANGSTTQYQLNVYDDLMFGKLITSDDISPLIANYQWVSGTVYSAYDQNNPNMYDTNFYVVADNNVYKCIFNNNGAESIIQPSMTDTVGTFETGDGYIWKYMYTITSGLSSLFSSTNYVPVQTNTIVSSSAVPGTIDALIMANTGSNYQAVDANTLVSIVNPSTVTIPTAAPSDNFFVGSSIYLKSGLITGQVRQIVSSSAAEKTITVSPAFTVYNQLSLSNITGTIATGYNVSQPIDYVDYLYPVGYFNANATLVQTDTGVSGKILTANSSVLEISRFNQSIQFSLNLPIFDISQSGIGKLGPVNISNSNTLSLSVITSNGSGYTSNATVSITSSVGSGAAANAQSNSSGKIAQINITNSGTNYSTLPTVTISPPANTTFYGNSTSVSSPYITLGSAQYFAVNDPITYYVSPGNTAIGGLVSGTTYYVQYANSVAVALSATRGGSAISLTPASGAQSGHALQGQTATAQIYPTSFIVTSANTAQTQLTDTANGYTVGDYIRVGTSNTQQNIRRTTFVNTSVILVDQAFSYTVTSSGSANNHYKMPLVAEPVSITIDNANAAIVNTNLSSITINIANASILGATYILGENVDLVNSSNTTQGANGIVSFSNTSTVILSQVNGLTNWQNSSLWSNNYFVRGDASGVTYNIQQVVFNPTITVENQAGNFVLGQPAFFLLNGANTGSATIIGSSIVPNQLTEYMIGPTVTADGDGSGFVGIGVVNTFNNSNTVSSILVINPGNNYTYANITITSNGNYGSGATANPVISPVHGHGYDAISELGGRAVGINVTFDTGVNEDYYFPTYGQYRRVGILQNPEFADVRVGVGSFDRVNLQLQNALPTTGPWTTGEIVYQPSTNSAGIVVAGNSTFLQLKNVRGAGANVTPYFTNTSGQANIYGLTSGTSANVVLANTIYFSVLSNTEIVSEVTSGANGIMTTALSNTLLQLTNAQGLFDINDTIYDPVTNAYATVTTISTASGTRDQSTGFGHHFNNLMRFTLTANSGAYEQYEMVEQQVSGASAFVMSTNNEIDIAISGSTGTFVNSAIATDTTTNANGVVLFANSSYVKLTNISNTNFVVGHTINSGSYTATISEIYPVLVLAGVSAGSSNFQYTPFSGISQGVYANVVGQTSGASGYTDDPTLITYPELVRNSGQVIYLENFQPVTRSANTKEQINIVIQY